MSVKGRCELIFLLEFSIWNRKAHFKYLILYSRMAQWLNNSVVCILSIDRELLCGLKAVNKDLSKHGMYTRLIKDDRSEMGVLDRSPPSVIHVSFSELSEHGLYIQYQVHIWQVMQRSFGNACQLLTWFKSSNMYLCTTILMTSSNGIIFCVTGPLCGEFTGQRWIPRTKVSDAELWCFLWSVPE